MRLKRGYATAVNYAQAIVRYHSTRLIAVNTSNIVNSKTEVRKKMQIGKQKR